jgi:hypothetical protein
MTPCQSVIAGFASADPAQMRPLVDGCTYADGAAFSPSEASAVGSLGFPSRALKVQYLVSTRLPRIRVWSIANKIEMLDVDEPPGIAADYLKVFGEPEAKLDYVWGDVPMQQSELVWPSKGLVVIAGEGVKVIVRAAIFVPTTLELYKRLLRYDAAAEDEDRITEENAP